MRRLIHQSSPTFQVAPAKGLTSRPNQETANLTAQPE